MFDQKRFIRLLAVIRKEISELLHQTRLIVTLIIGPFLILSLFGIGFQSELQPVDVLLLDPWNDPLQDKVEEFLPALGDRINLVATTADPDQAERMLRAGIVDLIILPPQDPIADIRSNQQSEFTIFHSEIDPFEESTVFVLGRVAADELNQQILTLAADQSKVEAGEAREGVIDTQQNSNNLRTALANNNEEQAQSELAELQQNVDGVASAFGAMSIYSSLQESIGLDALNESGDNPLLGSTEDLQLSISNLIIDSSDEYDDELASLDQIDRDLDKVKQAIDEFVGLDSIVLIAPFRSRVLRLTDVSIDDTDFFVPAALALLIQHMAVSFASLSIIRERRLGALALLRISPSSAFELLLGKTLGYLVVTVIIASILTFLVTVVMGVPMIGSWVTYGAVTLGIIFYSLSLGFVISTLAKTETQAVQLAMLLLLSSVFFSGLFLAVDRIWQPVQIVSWLLPATYGTKLLQDNMLRGQDLNYLIFAGLVVLGLLAFLLAWRSLASYLERE